MDSRLTNYLSSQRLARMLVAQAKEDADHGNLPRAMKHMADAVSGMITAQTNMMSIVFKKKPKSKRKVAAEPKAILCEGGVD